MERSRESLASLPGESPRGPRASACREHPATPRAPASAVEERRAGLKRAHPRTHAELMATPVVC
eukprot:9472732-Pyramimonas_sp.AAC.1